MLKSLKEKFQRKLNIHDGQEQVCNDDLWRIGFICKKDCYYITTEILKCLERNGYEWKIISSSYKIKCRKKKPQDPKEESRFSNINVLIQIFSVSTCKIILQLLKYFYTKNFTIGMFIIEGFI